MRRSLVEKALEKAGQYEQEGDMKKAKYFLELAEKAEKAYDKYEKREKKNES